MTSKKTIPGIYNFCDRWCERCAFTARCKSFQMEQEEESTPENKDTQNQAFWDRLSQNMVKARHMLEEMARKSGIDLTALEIAETDASQEKLRAEIDKHIIAVNSKQYAVTAKDWLKTQPGMLDKLEILKTELTMGIESQEQAKEHVAMIKDSLAVIDWYSSLIYTKLMRALMSRGNDLFDEEDLQSDSNGSAKVALIGIERSMNAWISLFNLLPEQEDHFLHILAQLEKMKNETLREFPKAMEFMRPGFDGRDSV